MMSCDELELCYRFEKMSLYFRLYVLLLLTFTLITVALPVEYEGALKTVAQELEKPENQGIRNAAKGKPLVTTFLTQGDTSVDPERLGDDEKEVRQKLGGGHVYTGVVEINEHGEPVQVDKVPLTHMTLNTKPNEQVYKTNAAGKLTVQGLPIRGGSANEMKLGPENVLATSFKGIAHDGYKDVWNLHGECLYHDFS
jgi:hypothetical protein